MYNQTSCNLLLERERQRDRETSCKVVVSHLLLNRHFSINVSLYFLESFSPSLKLQLYMIMREKERTQFFNLGTEALGENWQQLQLSLTILAIHLLIFYLMY